MMERISHLRASTPAAPTVRVARSGPTLPGDLYTPASNSDAGLIPRPNGVRSGPPGLTTIDEAAERRILGGDNRPAQMVRIGEARPNAPALLTIHGINDSPESMQSLGERGQREGQEVHTLVYDDRFRRLRDTSSDMAGQLRQWMDQNPGRPLQISAHSMGARIALGALSELQEQGRLEGRRVQLDLIAPPLGGFDAADLARLDLTGVLGGLVAGVRPGHDMGSTSGFQERLEALRLPPNVSTRIFLGGRDRLVDPNSPGFQRIAGHLNAAIVALPEAAHGNLPEHLSRR